MIHPKLPKISKVDVQEKNYGGQIEEDINHDGSTIEISSGATQSKWKTTVYKSIFGVSVDNQPTEEQVRFNPNNSTKFVLPSLNGDQIVINTDRLVLSSRFAETLHFSKKRYAVVTDDEYTVDANDQVVISTNRLTCINSPQIFLGQCYPLTNFVYNLLKRQLLMFCYLTIIHYLRSSKTVQHQVPILKREYPFS